MHTSCSIFNPFPGGEVLQSALIPAYQAACFRHWRWHSPSSCRSWDLEWTCSMSKLWTHFLYNGPSCPQVSYKSTRACECQFSLGLDPNWYGMDETFGIQETYYVIVQSCPKRNSPKTVYSYQNWTHRPAKDTNIHIHGANGTFYRSVYPHLNSYLRHHSATEKWPQELMKGICPKLWEKIRNFCWTSFNFSSNP